MRAKQECAFLLKYYNLQVSEVVVELFHANGRLILHIYFECLKSFQMLLVKISLSCIGCVSCLVFVFCVFQLPMCFGLLAALLQRSYNRLNFSTTIATFKSWLLQCLLKVFAQRLFGDIALVTRPVVPYVQEWFSRILVCDILAIILERAVLLENTKQHFQYGVIVAVESRRCAVNSNWAILIGSLAVHIFLFLHALKNSWATPEFPNICVSF